ncbi:MAG: ROK family protein [Candidatus Acidiferrales bacterium]
MDSGIVTSEEFTLDGRNPPILVFDVGGSHMAASVFDPQSRSIGAIRDLRVLPDGEPERFFKTFESLVGITLPAPAAPSGIAIAIPNPFDYELGISHMRHKFQSLYRMDLRRELARRIGCPPGRIHFLNDAAASLLGELCQGGALGARRAIGITLGTGVGSAFAVEGKIVLAGPGVPAGGEIWNQAYRDGIVEDYVSTVAIQRTFEELTGKRSDVRDIASSASHRQEAQQAFEQFGTELGKVLRQTCLAFAPDRIVMGGGIARAADHFLAAAKEQLGDFQNRLFVSELFERAPLIGAGISWLNRNGNSRRKDDRDRTTEQV